MEEDSALQSSEEEPDSEAEGEEYGEEELSESDE